MLEKRNINESERANEVRMGKYPANRKVLHYLLILGGEFLSMGKGKRRTF